MTAETDFSNAIPGTIAPDTMQLAVRRLAFASLLAVALGFVMQGLILGAKLTAGGSFPGILLLVDLAQGVTWAFFVCAGVSIGTALTRGRTMLAGVIAALFAPLALAFAKSAQKVMAQIIGAATEPGLLPLTTVGIFRAIEYGVLGWILAMLVQKQETRAWPYLGTGAAAGLLLGGTFVWLTLDAAAAVGNQTAPAQIAAMVVNEVFFPIGCTLVIYVSQWVGRSLKLVLQSS